jgi:hypothetical protein
MQRKKRFFTILYLAALLFTGALHAIDIAGEYVITGWDPYFKSNYTGMAVITKGENDVYEAEWSLGDRKFNGTGMRTGDVVSFISTAPPLGPSFNETEMEIYLSIYKISGKKLKGTWVRLHKTLIGTEDMEKRD